MDRLPEHTLPATPETAEPTLTTPDGRCCCQGVKRDRKGRVSLRWSADWEVQSSRSTRRGGEVFVLDMGEPVTILELARDLSRSHGLEPDQDIPIVFTGARPGEKLSEELLTAEEGTDSTTHEKVFVARLGSRWQVDELDRRLERLRHASERGDREEIVALLRELVPSYGPYPERDSHS